MRKLTFVLMLLFFLFAFAFSVEAKQLNKDFHESFDVQKGMALHLNHEDGDVTITPWDKDILDVEVRYRAEYKTIGIGGKLEFDVEFRKTDKAIHVIGREKCSGSIGFHSHKRYEHTYTIRAPEYLKLDLVGEDGDVNIQDWEGEISCDLEDGDIELEGISSPRTQIRIEDGDLNVYGIEGALSLHGEDGDITIREAELPRCRIDLEDGDIKIRRAQGDFDISVGDGDITLDQVRTNLIEISAEDGDTDLDLLKVDNIDVDVIADDGDVELDIEPGTSVAFSIETDEGRIRTDLPDADFIRKRRHRVSGEMHGGEGIIRIRTLDGNVVLRESR
jgi:hypothetical protein